MLQTGSILQMTATPKDSLTATSRRPWSRIFLGFQVMEICYAAVDNYCKVCAYSRLLRILLSHSWGSAQ